MFDVSNWEEWAKSGYIIIAGILIQQFLAWIIFPWVKKRIEKRVSATFQDILVNSVARPISFLVIMTALYLGLNTSPLHAFSPTLFLHIYRSTIIVAFFSVFYNLVSSSNGNLSSLAKKFDWQLDPLLLNLSSSILRMLIVVIGFLTLAKEWNYDVNGIIAGLGLGGLALAMASKDSLSNIFGGFVILTDKPFTIGDSINAAGYEGGVEDVTFRSTRIRTGEQGIVYIPNSSLANVPITNFSRRNKRRASYVIGLTYSTTKKQMQDCVSMIRKMLAENNNVSQNPGDTMVVFSGYGESSLNIQIVYFTATSNYAEYMQINNDIYLSIMDIVEAIGTDFAFPSQSLYIEQPVVVKMNVKEQEKFSEKD